MKNEKELLQKRINELKEQQRELERWKNLEGCCFYCGNPESKKMPYGHKTIIICMNCYKQYKFRNLPELMRRHQLKMIPKEKRFEISLCAIHQIKDYSLLKELNMVLYFEQEEFFEIIGKDMEDLLI